MGGGVFLAGPVSAAESCPANIDGRAVGTIDPRARWDDTHLVDSDATTCTYNGDQIYYGPSGPVLFLSNVDVTYRLADL